MKKVFMTLCLMLMAVGMYAQGTRKSFENSYFSMLIPEGWEVQNIPMEGVNMELVVFINGNDMRNVGMVIGIEQKLALRTILENQKTSQSNIFFQNATFGEIHSTTFMGNAAETMDFSTTFNGVHLKGAAYAFNLGDCSVMALGGYRPGMKSDLPQIWRSIQWKQHTKKQYASFEEELKDFIPSFNKLVKEHPVINSDCQTVSIDYDLTSKCIIYNFRLIKVSRFDFTEDSIAMLKQNMTQMAPALVKAEAANTAFVKRAMEHGYSFKYICSDKGDNYMYDVTVTPDQYNK